MPLRQLPIPVVVLVLLVHTSASGCGDDGAPERSEGTEVGDCVDRADNDGDGRFDCDDEGCAGSPDCRGGADAGTDGGSDGGPSDGGAPDAGSADGGTPEGAPCAIDAPACPTGQRCAPRPDEATLGACVRTGTGAEGADCGDVTDCQDGLVCAFDAVCRPFCRSVEGVIAGCEESGNVCVFQSDPAIVPPWGSCHTSCDAFGDDRVCREGEWCPRAEALCTVIGEGAAGAPCGGTDRCAEGLICANGECTQACDPIASPGAPGDTCLATEVCFGFCVDGCDFDDGAMCPEPDQTCVPEETLGADACLVGVPDLPPGGDCEAAGIPVAERCAAFSQCASFDDEPLACVDLCRPTVAPYGTTGHPDCRDARATCEDVTRDAPPDGRLPYGACR